MTNAKKIANKVVIALLASIIIALSFAVFGLCFNNTNEITTNSLNNVTNFTNNRDSGVRLYNDDDFEFIYNISKDVLENNNISESISKTKIYENGVETESVNYKLVEVSTYSFLNGKSIKSGSIYANPCVTEKTILTKLSNIYNQILSGEYFYGHNANSSSRLQGEFSKDANWNLIGESKVDAILEYDNTDYGDFSEWRSVFELSNATNASYFAMVNESYIIPDSYKTDFRSEKLVYKCAPLDGAPLELRNYAPKMKGAESTVSYSVSAGGAISSSGGSLSSSISTSYSALVSSPKITDNGNMSKNYGEVLFNYLNPTKNSGQYYEYNIAQSYQSSSFIFKSDLSRDQIVINNDRTIGIFRDGFWSNTLVNFNLDGSLTINR